MTEVAGGKAWLQDLGGQTHAPAAGEDDLAGLQRGITGLMLRASALA